MKNVRAAIYGAGSLGTVLGAYMTKNGADVELINRNRYSLFKTAGSTERPDTVVARLLEGRIAIMCDGTPVVLTIPYFFAENFQADDDYYTNITIYKARRLNADKFMDKQ